MATELDSLWGCVWRGEAPPEAIADWIVQEMANSYCVSANYRLPHTRTTLTLKVARGATDLWLSVLEARGESLRCSNWYTPGTVEFPALFPKWATQEIERLKRLHNW